MKQKDTKKKLTIVRGQRLLSSQRIGYLIPDSWGIQGPQKKNILLVGNDESSPAQKLKTSTAIRKQVIYGPFGRDIGEKNNNRGLTLCAVTLGQPHKLLPVLL